MPKAQKHCKLHDFYAWTVPKNYEKLAKNRPKNAQQGPPKRIFKFYPLFPTPNPQKRENPSRLKDFRGGSAAGVRPRVAKAMLSCHHYTGEASPDLRAAAPAADPGKRESDTTVCTMRHRTLLLLLLLLLLFLPRLKTHPAGQGNTVALKDGTAPETSPKTA